ncbi:MAG TPA: DRTGG domain-containing protein [Prolixibacteraceae bacterium]|nr:DRTGG domain-containing protein [Prolixibacteraceae bacterium]
MKVCELIEALDLTLLAGAEACEQEIRGGYVSDLLSDVMGNAREGNVWITLQNHLNVIAIASLKELSAVVLVNGNTLSEEVKQKADEEGIPVMMTRETAFSITGKIFQLMGEK